MSAPLVSLLRLSRQSTAPELAAMLDGFVATARAAYPELAIGEAQLVTYLAGRLVHDEPASAQSRQRGLKPNGPRP